MFDEFRRAWRQAVENFWAEVDGEGELSAEPVYREIGRARTQMEGLDAEIGETRRRLAEEREHAAVCERRARLARDIGDVETARVADSYGARHLERAAVLERKADALEAERTLCRRDLDEMERAVQQARADGRAELDDLNRHPAEGEFQDLEESDRDRAAAARLAALKRQMGGS